ncbi:hypothetical protein LINPERHAP2_LOCUS24905, partial [Linum perenne]
QEPNRASTIQHHSHALCLCYPFSFFSLFFHPTSISPPASKSLRHPIPFPLTAQIKERTRENKGKEFRWVIIKRRRRKAKGVGG